MYIPVTHGAVAPPGTDIGIIKIADRAVLAKGDKYLFYIVESQTAAW